MARPEHIATLIEKRWLKSGKLQDNFFTKTPLFDAMRKEGKDGGRELRVRLLTDGTGFKHVKKDDTFDTVLGDFATYGVWEWKSGVASIAMAGEDIDNANSKEDLINFVDEHIDVAMKQARKGANIALMSSTGVAGDSLSPDGFARAFAAGTTAYGGLSNVDLPSWAPQKYDSEIDISGSITDALVNTILIELLDRASDASTTGKPNKIFTTRAIFGKLRQYAMSKTNIITTSPRSGSGQALANLGYEVLELAGVPVIVEPNCPAKHMYAFNDESLYIAVHKKAEFKPIRSESGKIIEKVPRSNMYAVDILVKYNLVCSERRSLGVLTNVKTA